MASGHRSLQVKLLRSPFQVPRYPASKSSGRVCESELPVSSLAVLAGTASGGQVPATSGAASGPGSEAHSAEFHCHVRVPSESGVGWAAADLQGASPRMTMGGWRPGRPASGGGASLAGAGRGGCSAASGHPALSSRAGGGTSAGATSTHQSWHCGRRRAAVAGWGIQPSPGPL